MISCSSSVWCELKYHICSFHLGVYFILEAYKFSTKTILQNTTKSSIKAKEIKRKSFSKYIQLAYYIWLIGALYLVNHIDI